MTTRFSAFVAGAFFLLLAGCGGEPPAAVSGTVTLDQTPLADGDIIFEAADGQSTPAGGKVVNGRYALALAPGAKKVRINASKPPTKPDPVMGMAPTESMIPKEYNVETKLTADLKAGKQDGVNFDLKSKP